jgi:hypothetical protein
MRSRVLISLALTLAACGAPNTQPSATEASLPPGLWFQEGHYENEHGEGPNASLAQPHFAVVMGVYDEAGEAERAVRATPSALSAGYPWVVTTRDLMLAGTPPDRIAVVVGLFSNEHAAQAFAASISGARVATLVTTAFERTWCPGGDEARLWVTQIDPQRDAVGYPVEPIQRALQEADMGQGPAREEVLPTLFRTLPRCTIQRGSVFSTRDSDRYFAMGRTFAIVPCEGAEVAIPIEATMREAMFEYGAAGAHIHQVTAVECDTPTLSTWRYEASGRVEGTRAERRDPGC